MSELPLYRDAALQSSRFRWHGDVLIVSPLPARIAALISAVLISSICLYFIFGSYTKRVTVPGQIMPKAGVVKVYVQQPGVVIEERVVEGQHVDSGDVLFLISNDMTSSVGEVQAAISEQVERQRTSLLKQLDASKDLFEEKGESLAAKIIVAEESRAKLEAMIRTQRERVALSQQNLERYEQLQQFGTHDQLVARQTDLLEQRTRLEGLEREQTTLRGNLEDLQSQLTSLPIESERDIANLEAS